MTAGEGAPKLGPMHISDMILVALDGSPPAEAAASVAIQLAQTQHLAICGLYVVDERLVMNMYANSSKELGTTTGIASRPELIAGLKQRGEAALKWLEASCREARVPVTTDVLFGGVPELVLQAAARSELIALGRRGNGHSSDVKHLGRNLRAIAQHPPLPIVVGGDGRRPIQRLLLVYDPNRRNQTALYWASLFRPMLRGPTIVLAPSEDSQSPQLWFSEGDTQTQLERSSLASFRLVRCQGSLAAGIVASAAENDVDLIVMGEHRHTTLSRWSIGPVMNEVLRNTSLPVLLV
jgi:nucleotide-binding universal stress UspA family protein